jgi:sulfur carrier protein ThiS
LSTLDAPRTITIHLRASATLRNRLPALGGANALDLPLPAESTLRDLAAAIGLDLERERIVCVVNNRIALPDSSLQDGDQVRVMHHVAGG